MRKGQMKVVKLIPGAKNLSKLIAEFCRKPEGVLVTFSDTRKKAIAELLPDGAETEILEFGAVARRLATLCGEFPPGVARNAQVIAAVGTACASLEPDSPFYKTARFPGLHRLIAQTLHELAGWDVDAVKLDEIAARSTPHLAAKLRSLAALEEAVAENLRSTGRVLGRHLIDMCLASKPEPGVRLFPMLVLAGDEIPPSALNLLKWAVSHGATVHIVTYRHPKNDRLFKRADVVLDDSLPVERAGETRPILDALFSETEAESTTLEAQIVSAPDPLMECEQALRTCLRAHRFEGLPFESMAILARNFGEYAPLLELSAKRLDVPIQISRRAPLLTNSFAKLTLQTLTACSSRDIRKLSQVLRSSYAKLPRALAEELNASLLAARKEKDSWEVFEKDCGEKDAPRWLLDLLAWRREANSKSLHLESWIHELRTLISLLPWDDLPVSRERDVRAQYVLWQSVAAVAAATRGARGESFSLDNFVRVAEEVWSNSDASLPASSHGIRIVQSAEHLTRPATLHVLGMLEGSFPRRRSEDPILTDREREEISSLISGPRLMNSRDVSEGERDEFYLVCAAPDRKLIFSYPETDDERDNVPAFYLEEIKRVIRNERVTRMNRTDIIPVAADCLADSDRSIRSALDLPKIDPPKLEFSSTDTLPMLPSPPESATPGELRDALQCPFRHFARRRLDVRSNRLQGRWFGLKSLPQRANLLLVQDETAAREALHHVLELELDRLFNEVPDWEMNILRSGGERLINEWIHREFIARLAWPREETRVRVSFGGGELRSDLVKSMKISGGAAGFSHLGPYRIAHLLESRAPDIIQADPPLSDPDVLYYGIYLMAAFERGSASAVEVETMAGERLLLVLPRVPGKNLPSNRKEGLRVVDLGSDGPAPSKPFYSQVKKLLDEAIIRIRNVEVRAIPGDHCTTCDFGELCRNSRDFGEGGSPFAQED